MFCLILLIVIIGNFLEKDRIYCTEDSLASIFRKYIFGGYIGSSSHADHGLGNQLFHYISLYGIARQLGRRPFETSTLNGYDKKYSQIYYTFPNMVRHFEILRQEYYDNDCCKRTVQFADFLLKYDDPMRLFYIPDKYLLTTGQFYESYRYFDMYQKDVKTMLACNSSIIEEVQYRKFILFREDQRHKLCVHIRRGDFVDNPVLLHSEQLFTFRSIPFIVAYLKEQNIADNISVVAIGDDPVWAQTALENITEPFYVYHRSSSHAMDWCFAVHTCGSVVLTASGSTNGWWIGYMIRPKPVFYRKRSYKCGQSALDERYLFATDYYPQQWIPLEDENICGGYSQALNTSSCVCPSTNLTDLLPDKSAKR